MPERERQLLELRYGEGLLMREVAARLQISTARVAQLLARAEYRLARRVVYPGLDVMQRFEKREVPSGLALGEEPPRAPRTGPMTVRLYESRDPVPTQAPLGSLEDLLSALDRFPLEQRAELLQRASERILQETAEGES
jgi:DNA-directed RNA polymerase specialized sigma24 family protein